MPSAPQHHPVAPCARPQRALPLLPAPVLAAPSAAARRRPRRRRALCWRRRRRRRPSLPSAAARPRARAHRAHRACPPASSAAASPPPRRCPRPLVLLCAPAAARERGTARPLCHGAPWRCARRRRFRLHLRSTGARPPASLILCASPTPAAAAFVWRAAEPTPARRPDLPLAFTCPATSACSCCTSPSELPVPRAPAASSTPPTATPACAPSPSPLQPAHLLALCAAPSWTPQTRAGCSPPHPSRPWSMAHATSSTSTGAPTTSM